MNNKTKKGMMSRFLEGDLPGVAPSPTPPAPAKPKSPLSGMDVLNKAMGVLNTEGGQMSVPIGSIGIDLDKKRALSPAEFQRLRSSIETDGLFNPITVRRSDRAGFDFLVVAGHNRLQVLKELGHVSAPVNVVNFSDDGSRAAFISNLLQPELGIAEIFEGLKILRSSEDQPKSVRTLAKETGFSPAYVSQVLAMEYLPATLVGEMKKARVQVGSNVLKKFIDLFQASNGKRLEKLTSDASEQIRSTALVLAEQSPTLKAAEELAEKKGEDQVAKSWQQCLSSFIKANLRSLPKAAPEPKPSTSLENWAVSDLQCSKNVVTVTFDTEGDAAEFVALYKKLKV